MAYCYFERNPRSVDAPAADVRVSELVKAQVIADRYRRNEGIVTSCSPDVSSCGCTASFLTGGFTSR